MLKLKNTNDETVVLNNQTKRGYSIMKSWSEMRKGEKREDKGHTNLLCNVYISRILHKRINLISLSLCAIPIQIAHSFRLTHQKSQTLHWLTLLIDWPSLSPIWKFHPPIPEQYPVENAMRQLPLLHLLYG